MGLLNIFRAKDGDARTVLPAGSFTIDRNGKIIASTITSTAAKLTSSLVLIVPLDLIARDSAIEVRSSREQAACDGDG